MTRLSPSDAKYWLNLAEEMRAIAEQVDDKDSKTMILGIANDYERLAVLTDAKRRQQQQARKW